MMFEKLAFLGLVVLRGTTITSVVASSSSVRGHSSSSSSSSSYLRSLKFVWNAPEWYDRIASEDTTGLLRECSRRTEAPLDGDRCDFEEKICFFGTQECPGIGPHPTTMCYCDGETNTQQWSCNEESCPEASIAVGGAMTPDDASSMDEPPAIDMVSAGGPMVDMPAMEAPPPPLFGDQVDAPFKGDTYTDFPSAAPSTGEKEMDESGCPIGKTMFCEVEGQQCSWDDIKIVPSGASCTSTETCTCINHFFHHCALEMDCIELEADDMTDVDGGDDIGFSPPPFKDAPAKGDSFTDFPSAAPTEG